MKLASLLLSLFVFGCVFLAGSPALAQSPITHNPDLNEACQAGAESAFCKERGSTTNPLYGPDGVLTKAASILAFVTGVISMFIISIAALRFITSNGDSQKVASARAALIFALIGLVIAATAQVIATFILNQIE